MNYMPSDRPWTRMRVCHSDDPPSAQALGHCRTQEDLLRYMEVRVASQNWESVYFQAWIYQIVLSEMLDVPVTVETSVDGYNIDFYNIHSSMDYGLSNDWDALFRATEAGDCRKYRIKDLGENEDKGHSTEEGSSAGYQSCAHIVPETWFEDVVNIVTQLQKTGEIEPPSELGALGEQHWFMPKYTADRDPTLLSYLGLSGEKNRRKVAETFKRPTTWKDYCELVSNTTCSFDDGIASRPPESHTEESSYFVPGLYTGHFRATEENDCDTYPDTCTGR